MRHIFTLFAFLFFIPSATASPIIRELPTQDEIKQKDKKQTDNFGKAILRNHLSLSAGYSELHHNGIKNAKGGSIFLDAIAFFRIKHISLFSTLTLNFNSLAGELFSATETFTLLNTSLMARSRFRTTLNANHYITYGTACLLYTSPSPRDVEESRMPSSA